ncbi:MAG: hypothetical protein JXL81_01775 [Deltaproteobacteria bacterium]|nr:hypothetical protein [Deltaproteobacteria bacterium]
MRLDLRFTNRPLEELWCQAVVLLSFKVRDKMSLPLDSIDKKMAGSIRNIVRSGMWSGDCGDKLLFATQNSIRADKLLINGLGEESVYSIDVLKSEIENTGNALVKMGISEFGFQMTDTSRGVPKFDIHIETAIKKLVAIYLEKYRDVPDFILKMYISITNDYIKPVEKVADRLRDHFLPLTEFSIILDKGAVYQATGISGLAA